jgi:predicted DNA-binding transcriptional regulator AlpA
MVREGLFPPHIKLSANRIGWIEEDIDAWIASRKEQ